MILGVVFLGIILISVGWARLRENPVRENQVKSKAIIAM